MLEMSIGQVNSVTYVFAATIAAMGGAAIFFAMQRSEAAPKYRVVLALLSVVCLIAAYNYRILYLGWTEAYSVVDGAVKVSGLAYNDSYRYADWLLTVPTLLVVLVLVMDLPPARARLRCVVLGTQAVEMVVLGYPGQGAPDMMTRWLWWIVAMVPFVIIIHQLYVALRASVDNQPPAARGLVSAARFLTVSVWSVYPVLYLLPILGLTGPLTFATTQVTYALADVTAKAAFGMLIYTTVMRKSEALRADGAEVAPAVAAMAQT